MPQKREDFLYRLARQPKIDRIRAKIQVARPSQGTIVGDGNLLEEPGIEPSCKYPDTCEIGKIDDATNPVVELELQPAPAFITL